MPRITRVAGQAPPRHTRLLKELVSEFRHPGKTGTTKPYILEEVSPRQHSRQLHVIWDALSDLAYEDRFDLVINAYREVEGETAAAEVTTALGLTAIEALACGLLPFAVRPKRHQAATGSRRTAGPDPRILDEAKATLLGADHAELRYATRDEADAAVQRLEVKFPSTEWSVRRDDPDNS